MHFSIYKIYYSGHLFSGTWMQDRTAFRVADQKDWICSPKTYSIVSKVASTKTVKALLC